MKGSRVGRHAGVCLVILCIFAAAFPNSSWSAFQNLPGFPGWQVDYNFVYNGYITDLYAYNGVNRFWYNQGPGQWFDRSAVYGAWSVLGPAGQSRTFIGDHNWHTFADNKSFQLNTNNDWGVWRDNGVERFLYDYTRGQWCDRSAVNGTWSCLGPANQLSAFIGDHNWRTFTDNRSYQYYTNNQWGVWLENGQYRFLYDYAAGQWKDRSVGNGTWSNLGPANQLSAYIGDHQWHDFGDGITYRFYDNNSWGTFRQDGTYRFLYDYAAGQWQHRSTADGTWYALGNPGQLSAWICDGNPHDLQNGWSYSYTASVGTGYWLTNSANRFAYAYTTGQWEHGSGVLWSDLGAAGLGPAFTFDDGAFHALDSTWSYKYTHSTDTGYWKKSGDTVSRFSYGYGAGQWYHQGDNGGWIPLGLTSMAPAFVGDGNSHIIVYQASGYCPWEYSFTSGSGIGYWSNTGYNYPVRFMYDYSTGQWQDQGGYDGNTWVSLGPSGLSAAFLGDGGHRLDSRWEYSFTSGSGIAVWTSRISNNSIVFSYDFTTGQWMHRGNYGEWGVFEPNALSSSFLGDGNSHTLDGNWLYSFNSGIGYWTGRNNNPARFMYDYVSGQWMHRGNYGGWARLGPTALGCHFMASSGSHQPLDSNWSYSFSSGIGYWSNRSNNLVQFKYDYGTGQWSHESTTSGWNTLGISGLAPLFMGDGNLHYLGTASDEDYKFLVSNNYGYFYNHSTGALVFSYYYGN